MDTSDAVALSINRGLHFYGVPIPRFPSVAIVNQQLARLRRRDDLVAGKLQYIECRQVGMVAAIA